MCDASVLGVWGCCGCYGKEVFPGSGGGKGKGYERHGGGHGSR